MQPQGASVSAGMSSSATGLGVTEGKESAPGSSGSSLLVLATSARYTLARVLTSYDEEMEEEMAGGV